MPRHHDEILVHLCPVLICVDNRNVQLAVRRFREVLYSYSVQTELPYPIVLGTPEQIPNAYELAKRMVLIPCNASLTEEKINLIGHAVFSASDIITKEFL